MSHYFSILRQLILQLSIFFLVRKTFSTLAFNFFITIKKRRLEPLTMCNGTNRHLIKDIYSL